MTAAIVAWGRGVASAHPMVHPPLRDHVAKALLPAPVAWLIPREDRARSRLSQAALRVVAAGLVDQMALRSSAIDDVLRGAVRSGVDQVVILGAGLDGRAYRLDELDRATVFEIDHPATQRYKLSKLAGLAPHAKKLVHVAIDFTTGASLGDALSRSGHDANASTLWIWEGVTMYLTRAQTRQTLAVVGARSAAGSVLATSYMTPDGVPLPAPLRRAVDATMGALGEPLEGAITPNDMADLLRDAGLVVASDESSLDWAHKYGASARVAFLFGSERIAVARRA